jgi:hypothetical protein
MRRHWLYFRYLARHKYFVFIAGLRTGAPLWRLVIHDWSKFLPSEWLPYSRKFYGPPARHVAEKQAERWRQIYEDSHGPMSLSAKLGHLKAVEQLELDTQERIDHAFNVAWLKHQHRNPHHWQHWLLAEDNPSKRLETPQSSGAQRAFPLRMPVHFVREMVADWCGAGRAITGKWEVGEWYMNNRQNIILHHETAILVRSLILNFKAPNV